MSKQIIALALVTQEELELLGPQFARAYPIDQAPCFGELLQAIDVADRELWRARDQASRDANTPMEIMLIGPNG